MTISPDGKVVVAACNDGSLQLFATNESGARPSMVCTYAGAHRVLQRPV